MIKRGYKGSPIVTLRVSPEWLTQIDRIAKEQHVSRAQLIKEAILFYLTAGIKEPNKE